MQSRAEVEAQEKEIGAIFARGALIGVPFTFAVTYGVSMAANLSAGAAGLISGWGALIMGPFVGAMIFMAGRVGRLTD